jgi:hypothetical protein
MDGVDSRRSVISYPVAVIIFAIWDRSAAIRRTTEQEGTVLVRSTMFRHEKLFSRPTPLCCTDWTSEEP